MKDKKIFALLSGLLFIVSSIWYIGLFIKNGYIVYLSWLEWSQILIYVGIGITLLWGRINVGTVALFGADTVIAIIYLMRCYFGIGNFISLIIDILLMVCCIMVIVKSVKEAKILIFIPIVLYVLRGGFLARYSLIWDVIVIAAYILLALYINSITFEKVDAVQPLTKTLNVVELGAADQLLQYKELLNTGIISQEEFDAKKKQLLGL